MKKLSRKIFTRGRAALILSRNKECLQKAVLPALLFVNLKHPLLKGTQNKGGFLLILQWWDYSIKFGLFSKENE